MESAKEHSNDAYRDLPDKSFLPLIRGNLHQELPQMSKEAGKDNGTCVNSPWEVLGHSFQEPKVLLNGSVRWKKGQFIVVLVVLDNGRETIKSVTVDGRNPDN